MLLNNICDALGFTGGWILIIFGMNARRSVSQKSAASSLFLAGAGAIIWSALGEILAWGQFFISLDLVRMFIGGITVGILINITLARQAEGLKELERKRAHMRAARLESRD